jgi:hypothetical protein
MRLQIPRQGNRVSGRARTRNLHVQTNEAFGGMRLRFTRERSMRFRQVCYSLFDKLAVRGKHRDRVTDRAMAGAGMQRPSS